MKKCSAKAPGKLILSGEHAVVHGCPAIAMAVDRYAETTISTSKENDIHFDLKSLSHSKTTTLKALRDLKSSLKNKHHQFQKGDLSIRGILKTPFELAHFAAINTIDRVKEKLSGIHVHTDSSIPQGCGLGSSAATSLSIIYAIAQFHELSLTEDEYIELAQDAEKLQHGYPSGLDVITSLRGGTISFQNGQTQAHASPTFQLFIVNTGQPESSTGECVSHVNEHFKDDPIWKKFTATTEKMSAAIQNKNHTAFKKSITDNQRLLEHIQVVPKKVCEFITAIENIKGAAKICGAGSIAGDNAGVVLIDAADIPSINDVCHRYHYSLEIIQPNLQGVQSV